MKDISVYSVGDPGAFDLSKGADMYWTERVSYEFTKMLYDMSLEGFEVRQDEPTDYTDITSDFNTYAGSLATWFTTAVQASNDGDVIPAPPSVPALPGNTLPGILITIFLRVFVRIIVDWLRKKLDPDTQALEIAAILKKALLLPDPENGDISILELLASVPIEIILSKYGDVQDVNLSSRVE